MKNTLLALLTLFVAGCSTYGAIDNQTISQKEHDSSMLLSKLSSTLTQGEYTIAIAMSGGGTRAAALSYGVLKALNAELHPEDPQLSILDEVDIISSVSGGSFTAAYYGLYGKRIFDDFEDKFLYHDVKGDLYIQLLSPSVVFSSKGRTAEVIEYYESQLFNNATFDDLKRDDTPFVIINASDLGAGVRFSFIPEYFNLLCSDLDSYSVASAVAASSAVPLMFNPVVLQNHDTCEPDDAFLDREFRNLSSRSKETLLGLASYRHKQRRPYIHLVDGGITDNLGLLSFIDILELSGGVDGYFKQSEAKPLPHYVIISIDASTTPDSEIDDSAEEPGIAETISAITGIQLHRYNTTTKGLIEEWGEHYQKRIQEEHGTEVVFYFISIDLSFDPAALSSQDISRRKYLNSIPTDFTLQTEQVDALIDEGYIQLQNHPQFLRFLSNIRQQTESEKKRQQNDNLPNDTADN